MPTQSRGGKHRFPMNVENVSNYFSRRDIFHFSHTIKLIMVKWNQDLILSFFPFSFSFSPLDFPPLCLPLFVQPTSFLSSNFRADSFPSGIKSNQLKELKMPFLVLHFIGMKICMLLVLEWFWNASLHLFKVLQPHLQSWMESFLLILSRTKSIEEVCFFREKKIYNSLGNNIKNNSCLGFFFPRQDYGFWCQHQLDSPPGPSEWEK